MWVWMQALVIVIDSFVVPGGGSYPHLSHSMPLVDTFWLPLSTRSRSAVTVGELKSGLEFEAVLAMEAILFILSLSAWMTSLYASTVGTLISSSLFTSWFVLISIWRRKPLVSIISQPFVWLPLFPLTAILEPNVSDYYKIVAFINVLYQSGYHPFLGMYIQVPLSSPRVLTGLGLLFLLTGGYFLTMQTFSIFINMIVLWYVYAFTAAMVAAVCIATAVKEAMASLTAVPFILFNPFKDTYMSIRSVLNFRTQTGLRVSSFIRLLSSEDQSMVVDYHSLMDWFGQERGVAVWTFLCEDWKQYRLGRLCDPVEDRIPSDVLNSIEIKRLTDHLKSTTTQPIRSPLLRGY
jgi:hypothetical protein